MQFADSKAPQGGLSLVQGAATPDLLPLTFSQLLEQQAERYGSKDAILIGWTKARLSFQDLNERTKQLARGLLAMGVRKGDRIAILSGDDERFIELFFAVGRIGAILVILNKTYTPTETERGLNHAEPYMLFIADILNKKPVSPLLRRLTTQGYQPRHTVLLRSEEAPDESLAQWEDVLHSAGSISEAELAKHEETVDPDSIVNFQFTSGTTGSPKAAMLSHL
ncbi:hypothetical protein NW762_010694 [Fusarium torreyae]|uniref:AMP-dependent synthetase/ligase domain-containing protein n=1 Tax=Fusarium torreyae TaxID=1237075 RepID=A0A9W8RSG7_9HYPO|nr:hypothetical protein NW762_010694 [Fusarium torreyae]